ncbi:flagellar motor switch protein FliN [Microbulbifer elongatus]|uniref:Flagellar motor switch protein FliN n=1 Tax=Microbulbifer elongatus TaxID=86173 RepID=A0ABT1NWU0_9GAMM|nr:flagellar motor switch protein FliN [Microbulbifer elongatus]MCQ3828357.1 flagellar motor switch protein FliN [Microbulbifer elongatus]
MSDNDHKAQENETQDTDSWAAAMAEQLTDNADDAWSEALSEQKATSGSARSAADDVFKPLENNSTGGAARDLEMVMDIPVKLSVELGRTRITIKQLLELAQGSVIELDGLAGEPMDILINGYLVAQGEVVVIEEKYGIRITEIVTPQERIHKLNR